MNKKTENTFINGGFIRKLKLENIVRPLYRSPLALRSLFFNINFCLSAQWNIYFSACSPRAIVFLQPFNPASQTNSLNQLSVIWVQQTHPWICILISHHRALWEQSTKNKFSSNYTSKSAIITTLYIICIFQLIFKSCIGFCMQMYNIFRIRYITVKSISIQPLPCFSLISCVPW